MAKRIKTIDIKGTERKPGLWSRLLTKMLPDRSPEAVEPEPQLMHEYRLETEAIVRALEAEGRNAEAERFSQCVRAFPSSTTEYFGEIALCVESILADERPLSATLRARLEDFRREYLSRF